MIDKYKNGEWKAPSPDIDVRKKGDNYYILAAQAFLNSYLNDRTAIPYSKIGKMRELRLYGIGRQPTDKYKEFYTSEVNNDSGLPEVQEFIDGTRLTKEQLREGWGNMDFDSVVSIAPKINLSLHGMMDDIDWVVSATSTDPKSGSERMKLKWGTMLEKEHGNFLKEMNALAGIPSETPPYIPESLTELELYEATGGFKIQYERAIEKSSEHSFDISNWDEMKAECIDDVRDWNALGLKTYVCETSGKVLSRQVDLTKFVIQFSRHYDHHDATRAAEITEVTVGSLRKYFSDETTIKKIAQVSSGYSSNPKLEKWEDYNTRDEFGEFKYDHYLVPIFDMVFMDYDNHYEVEYTPKVGYTKLKKAVAPDYEVKDREAKTKTTVHNLKKVKWIIGTDYCYDFGIDNDMMRPNIKDVILPYIFIKFPGKSITESLVPHHDDIMHIHLRTQNALITAAMAGFAMDVDLLQNVTLGGEKMSELSLFDIYRHKGVLFFKRQDMYGQSSGGGIPVFELPGGIGRLLDELLRMLQHTLTMIETITGINPTTLGATPDERTPVRTTQMAVKGTENILRPMIRGLKNSKKRLAERFVLTIPKLVKYYENSRKSYESVIGKYDTELLKMVADDIYMMGIKLEPKLTHVHQESLMRMVELAMQKDANGQAGLGLPEGMLIQERILNGTNLKLVRMEISSMIRQAQNRMLQEREHLLRVQAEETRGLEGQKHQQELQRVDVDTRAKMDIDNNKFENELKMLRAKSNLELIENAIYQEDAEEEVTPTVQDDAGGGTQENI